MCRTRPTICGVNYGQNDHGDSDCDQQTADIASRHGVVVARAAVQHERRMTALNPALASRTARHAYWKAHGLAGNRAEAERAADLAFNAAVMDGPPSWPDRSRTWTERRHRER